jgi:cytidylate kinase
MQPQSGLEKCLPFLSSECQPWTGPPVSRRQVKSRLAITISRQSGSGAHVVATKLAEYLGRYTADAEYPWAVFDRNLVEQVLEDHHLPSRLARFMPEDRTSELSEVLDELLGNHPPSIILVQQTAETVLRLAQRGHVILIGRGSNLITSGMENVFHVRLVGSLDKRIAHIQQTHGLDRKAAIELIHTEDRGRRRYLRKYFDADPDEPKQYHLVINTDRVDYDKAAAMILDAALGSSQQRLDPLRHESI